MNPSYNEWDQDTIDTAKYRNEIIMILIQSTTILI